MYNTARVLQEGAANFVWAPLPGASAVWGRACHSSLGWHLVVIVFCKLLWYIVFSEFDIFVRFVVMPYKN